MTVRILNAAYDRMLQFGITRTTVEDVARQAGVARITIYRRFPNREELVRAVVLREAARIFGLVDAAVEGLESPEDQLVEGFVAVLREVRTHPLVIRLLATEIDLLLPVVTVEGGPVVAVARQYLAGHLRRAQTAGRMRRSDPEAVAELLVRLTLSFLVTPDSCIPLATDRQARAFARRFLVPLSQLSFPAER